MEQSNEETKNKKNQHAQKKQSGYKVRAVSPEARRESCGGKDL